MTTHDTEDSKPSEDLYTGPRKTLAKNVMFYHLRGSALRGLQWTSYITIYQDTQVLGSISNSQGDVYVCDNTNRQLMYVVLGGALRRRIHQQWFVLSHALKAHF